jgi:AcrR family transcriptional regulator
MPAAARRERILAAALEAFGDGGYGATSMGDVAGRAGVTRAVLYDHFASKKSLFLAVIEEQNTIFLGHVGASISGSGTQRDRMRETMSAVFSFAQERPQTWSLLFGNASNGDGDVDDVVAELHRRRAAAVGLLLSSDFEDAGIAPDDRRAQIIVEMLISALRGAVEWRRVNPDAGNDDLIDAGTDLLWTGLGHLGS